MQKKCLHFCVNAEGMASNPHTELGFKDAAASQGVSTAQLEHNQMVRAALTQCLGERALQGSGFFGARVLRLANPVLHTHLLHLKDGYWME